MDWTIPAAVDEPQRLCAAAASARYAVNAPALREAARRGLLVGEHLADGQWTFAPADLEAYLAAQTERQQEQRARRLALLNSWRTSVDVAQRLVEDTCGYPVARAMREGRRAEEQVRVRRLLILTLHHAGLYLGGISILLGLDHSSVLHHINWATRAAAQQSGPDAWLAGEARRLGEDVRRYRSREPLGSLLATLPLYQVPPLSAYLRALLGAPRQGRDAALLALHGLYLLVDNPPLAQRLLGHLRNAGLGMTASRIQQQARALGRPLADVVA